MIAEITSTSEFNELISHSTPVIVDFHADWCGPCKIILPIFKKMSEKPEYQGIKFVRVDTEEQEEVAREWSVRVMPTFMLFRNGEKVEGVLGARPAPLEELVKKGVALSQTPPTGTTETGSVESGPALIQTPLTGTTETGSVESGPALIQTPPTD